MNVVFLALGATRRAAVVAESARVVAAGGAAAVLVEERATWKEAALPGEVTVVELPELERRYRPGAVTLLLFRVPDRLLRVCAPGPLRRWGGRLRRAFRRRVAHPLDRRLARRYRRDTVAVRRRTVRRAVLAGGPPDLVVVADAGSFAVAAELMSKGPGRRLDVAFHSPVGAGSPGTMRRSDAG